MQMADYKIFEGKYIPLIEPTHVSKIICTRCGKSQGSISKENEGTEPQSGKYVWFCTNPECLRADSEASKQIDRKKALQKLRQQQQENENVTKNL